MTGVKSHGALTVGTVAVRRKPALTYQSPAQNTATLHPEKALFTSQSATAPPLPSSPPTQLSQMPELSQRSMDTHKSSRHHMITALLPLYHPFGTLALSLPDLDPTAFGLPAPVAVFDDPTRRSSNRQRRPAAKVRDADEPATPQPPSFATVTPTLESEVREKSSPRRRRGGGPGGKRKRREPDDGDATYPAKRTRNPRSSGVPSGLSSTRALSREEGSPTLSNAHSGVSPALDAGRADLAEEKKSERRTTRSRRAIVRQDSTASEDTATSASPSVSATNTVVPRVASSGEPMETDEPAANDALDEATAPGVESNKADPDDIPVLEQQEN
ncbi:hypothetical protein J3R83DRAFT_4308 [Lanmaoa asiatica]|nr:hypothetical protein J3R83DRAFT_4308 [Lanmaoa asiatica]